VLTIVLDKTARLWSAASGNAIGRPLRHKSEVLAVAFSPDGKTVLTGSADNNARLWSAATGKALLPPLRHLGAVSAVAFSPDGQTVLTGSTDRTARLWSAVGGKALGPPLRHHYAVKAVAFSPDGQTVLTGSGELFDVGEARLWSAASGIAVGPPLRHQSEVSAVAFSPDGKTVFTGSGEQTARLWKVPVALEGSSEWIKVWTQVLTGTELDPHGVVEPLNGKAWQQRRKLLAQLGGSPKLRRTPKAWRAALQREKFQADLARHDREAEDSLHSGQWFAALFHLNPLVKAQPDQSRHFLRRGRAHAERGQWKKAAADFARAIRLKETKPEPWTGLALMRLRTSDKAGYRKVCARLLKRFGKTTDPAVAKEVAWTFMFAPAAVPDLAQPVRLARLAVEKLPKSPYRPLQTLGAALYRFGKWEEAVQRLNQAIKAQGKGGTALDWLLLAMAHQRLNHAPEARKWLDQAVTWMDKNPQVIRAWPWEDRLALPMLRREAKALLKEKPKQTGR
jgi:tetratricopeptide (TPR) repeat protein